MCLSFFGLNLAAWWVATSCIQGVAVCPSRAMPGVLETSWVSLSPWPTSASTVDDIVCFFSRGVGELCIHCILYFVIEIGNPGNPFRNSWVSEGIAQMWGPTQRMSKNPPDDGQGGHAMMKLCEILGSLCDSLASDLYKATADQQIIVEIACRFGDFIH